MKEYYSNTFFQNQMHNSELSASEVVPHVLKLVDVKSVIDVGCGIGTWLSVFQKNGVTDIQGIDGEWVDKKMLMIPTERFLNRDLTKPIQLGKKFDLVISLEVAEHLNKEFADTFIASLTSLGPIILFSAAIPMQGGQHHVNEQWPEYWATLFEKYDYALVDCVRKKVWNNPNVGCWYAQNIFLFVKQDVLNKNEKLLKEYNNNSLMLSIVHPRLFLEAMEKHNELRKNYNFVKKLLFPVWWLGKLVKRPFVK
jgi:hypothetical protein